MQDEERRRSTVDASGAQMGDVQSRDAAGRDIYHQGMDPEVALAQTIAFIKEHVWRADQQREERDRELTKALEYLGDQFRAYQIMESRRQAAEAKEREERREELDAALAELVTALAVQGDDLTAMRRWLTSITLAVIALSVILAGVVWYELGLLARALYDVAGPALAYGRRL